MTSCVFCAIAAGSAAAHIVHEDEQVLAFMDIHPQNTGHLLVIPRIHIPHFIDLDPALYAHLMDVSRQMAAAANAAFGPRRVGLVIAGFEIPHTHIHVLPLKGRGDLMTGKMVLSRVIHPRFEELEPVADQLRAALNGQKESER
jgi:histidine triad (HIT) family protein